MLDDLLKTALIRTLNQNHKQGIKKFLSRLGYDHTLWVREPMYSECRSFLVSLDTSRMDALGISSGGWWKTLEFRSFVESTYPPFDICAGRMEQMFNIIIADQVFEHLLWPLRAVRNVHAMLRQGGYFIITTPFLIKIHNEPVDCSRWSELGLKHLLAEGGFSMERITTGSWGNKACVRANLRKFWPARGWHRSLVNEPDLPVTVWAFAQKVA